MQFAEFLLGNIPGIILNGHEWYSGIGTESSKGTKIFALAGKVVETGLVEVPMGATLREIVFDVGGGIPEGGTFKAAQMGGPSGGCVPAQYLDLPIDYESVKEVGAIMGSGGLVVMDDRTCMVDVARFFQEFTQKESCGKCVPCRVGTRQLVDILTRICAGEGEPGDIEKLESLAQDVKVGSLCGLGQTAANPVLTTIAYFRDEYEAHIREKRCPAGVCRSLISFRISAPRFRLNSSSNRAALLMNSNFLRMSLDKRFLSDCDKVIPSSCFSIIFSSDFPNIFLEPGLFFNKSIRAIYNHHLGYNNHHLGYI